MGYSDAGTLSGYYDLCNKIKVAQNVGNWGWIVFQIILTILGPPNKKLTLFFLLKLWHNMDLDVQTSSQSWSLLELVWHFIKSKKNSFDFWTYNYWTYPWWAYLGKVLNMKKFIFWRKKSFGKILPSYSPKWISVVPNCSQKFSKMGS